MVGDEMGFGIRGPIWLGRIVAEESGVFRSKVDVAVGNGANGGFGWEAFIMGVGSRAGTEIGARTCRVSGGTQISGGVGGFWGDIGCSSSKLTPLIVKMDQ
ncbi:hypothetical protein AAC387_Pa03g0523 [Persea americana]